MPYVEFDTAGMPNLAAYGVAIPAMALITSTLQHRDRIPAAVLALVGVFALIWLCAALLEHRHGRVRPVGDAA